MTTEAHVQGYEAVVADAQNEAAGVDYGADFAEAALPAAPEPEEAPTDEPQEVAGGLDAL